MRKLTAAAGLLAMLLAAAPAAGQSKGTADCDPAVAKALEDSAVRGVERDQVLIRHQEEGIGDPDSIYDLSCDLLNFPTWDALVRLPTLPDLFGQLCDAARAVWRGQGHAALRPGDLRPRSRAGRASGSRHRCEAEDAPASRSKIPMWGMYFAELWEGRTRDAKSGGGCPGGSGHHACGAGGACGLLQLCVERVAFGGGER